MCVYYRSFVYVHHIFTTYLFVCAHIFIDIHVSVIHHVYICISTDYLYIYTLFLHILYIHRYVCAIHYIYMCTLYIYTHILSVFLGRLAKHWHNSRLAIVSGWKKPVNGDSRTGIPGRFWTVSRIVFKPVDCDRNHAIVSFHMI